MLKVEACAECGSRASQDHDAAAALRGILESKLQLINQLRAQSIAFFGAIQSQCSYTVIGFSEDVLVAGHTGLLQQEQRKQMLRQRASSYRKNVMFGSVSQ